MRMAADELSEQEEHICDTKLIELATSLAEADMLCVAFVR